MKFITALLRHGLLLLFCLIPCLGMSQQLVTGKAYRSPEAFKDDSAMASTVFVFTKQFNDSNLEGYRVYDQTLRLSADELQYAVWIITDGKYLFFNSQRHGFRNRYLKFKKHGNYYFFSAQPILSAYQNDRLIDAYHANGLLGVALAYRRMNYQNTAKRDHLLDLEKGTTLPLSVDYMYQIIMDYPTVEIEFLNDTTTLTLERLLYYLDKVNHEWERRKDSL